MSVHDWARVDDGFFHNFHGLWLAELCNTLNDGRLPADYFAMIEQHAGVHVPDLLTMAERTAARPVEGGVAVAEPRAARSQRLARLAPVPRRWLAVRNGRRVVGVIEVVSPNNKNREGKLAVFVEKVCELIESGVNTAVLDLLPPGPHDPGGIHPAICAELRTIDPPDPAPADQPLTFVGYRADDPPFAYLNYAAVGQPLPAVPLYLDAPLFVELPLHATYKRVYSNLPTQLRAALG